MKFDEQELSLYIDNQVKNMLCYNLKSRNYISKAIELSNKSFNSSSNKYYQSDKYFSPFHSAQYCVLLYYLSKVMLEIDLYGINAEKIYLLNKIINSVDLFYEIELPTIFGVEHPLGSVMGRAEYSDYLFFYQGCTLGGSNGNYPIIGKNLLMYSNSKILGKCRIGHNVVLSANSYIINTDIPDNCIVFGSSPHLTIRKYDGCYILGKQKHIWNMKD